jgi:hypothetical protein
VGRDNDAADILASKGKLSYTIQKSQGQIKYIQEDEQNGGCEVPHAREVLEEQSDSPVQRRFKGNMVATRTNGELPRRKVRSA